MKTHKTEQAPVAALSVSWWIEQVRASHPDSNAQAVAGIACLIFEAQLEGRTACVWHQSHEWHVRNHEPHPCAICGGEVWLRSVEQHELCRARRERGLPTPLIDSTPACGCYACRREGGAR